MNNRYTNNTPYETEDPYERGFAHKLYENAIGVEPVYATGPYTQRTHSSSAHSSASGHSSGQDPRRKKKKKHSFFGFLFKAVLFLIFLLMIAGIFLHLYAEAPMESEDGRLNGSASILVVGSDESGLNTDTLMLVNVDRANGQLSIMSIPRDTKVDSTYVPHKINGAYAANGGGEDGMFWLCDYVRQCVGFHPDAYILVDLDCFIELVDLFGGVEFEVPMDMHYEDPAQDLYIHLEKGLQTLDGKDAMGVVRFRKGYDMQDLERVNVQREFLMTAMQQWMSVKNVTKLPKALEILNRYCLTNLSTSNLLWLAESVALCGTDDMMMTTIPYTLGSDYVYIKADDDYLALINQHFNPYEDPVEYEDLNIAD